MLKDPKQLRDHFSFIVAEGEVPIAEVGWIYSTLSVHSESVGHLENKKISAESCSVQESIETGNRANQLKMQPPSVPDAGLVGNRWEYSS